MKKIIVQIKGGIGNQLFCYAAAKRLAVANNAELVIDSLTGFERDSKYNRRYMLNHFNISTRQATSTECLMPFSRYRRFLLKWISINKPFEVRKYIEQNNNDFDERLLYKHIKGRIFLEGYWQSENYFKDIENIIRQDLEIIPPKDIKNIELAEKIMNTNAVCIHVRWFNSPLSSFLENNIGKDYYRNAIANLKEKANDFHFYIFSDYPDETKDFIELPELQYTFINHNKGDENAYADLWLMSLCKHFIIANSTFSWWGAWLSKNQGKIVIAPKKVKEGEGAWGFKGLLPENWILI